MSKRLCASLLFVTATACAGGSSSANEPNAPAATRSADVITAEELRDPMIVGGDALEAVRRLRPRFLASRYALSVSNPDAGATHVSVDGGALVSLDNLSHLRPNQISQIRYLNANDASQRFGTASFSGPVILVTSGK